jgi:hypothetical protein
MSNNAFNINIAKKYGINEAIMINTLQRYVDNNMWYYGQKVYITFPKTKFYSLFSFWSVNEQRDILNSLIKQGVFDANNFKEEDHYYSFAKEKLQDISKHNTTISAFIRPELIVKLQNAVKPFSDWILAHRDVDLTDSSMFNSDELATITVGQLRHLIFTELYVSHEMLQSIKGMVGDE